MTPKMDRIWLPEGVDRDSKRINANSHGPGNYSFWAPGPIQLNKSIKLIFLIILSEDPGRGQFIQLNSIL